MATAESSSRASTGTAEYPTGNIRSQHQGYLPIENYGLIGNMRTCALVGMDGSIDYMCWPEFDSPSVFCRLLDKNKGGYFSIHPSPGLSCTTKQQYLPSCNILQTRSIHEDGVVNVVDFFPRPKKASVLVRAGAGIKQTAYRETTLVPEELKRWLVRRVECIRGRLSLDVEIFPAFGYATEPHETTVLKLPSPDHESSLLTSESKAVTFHSKDVKLQLDVSIDSDSPGDEDDDGHGHGHRHRHGTPVVAFKKVKKAGMLGEGVVATIVLEEGQAVSFVLRNDVAQHITSNVSTEVLDMQQHDTQQYWYQWISQSKYNGKWREVVARSLMILKLMTYEPTGAIIAAPTFSVPEHIGGVRNWDYRFSWVRDSSFTIYILLRLGFTDEADAYMDFISARLQHQRMPDGGLPIMFTIHGGTDMPERELSHLEGYRGSRPVRIGNGAAFHQQFDIYGELMDAMYLYNKYGKPISWDLWCAIRDMLDYVLTIIDEPDMSIWEVRNKKQHFTYSKIMLWVAFDRGLRLAEKRNLPCPSRAQWLQAKDRLYEEIMVRGYNKDLECFVQSYESRTVLDSSILIAPLVFFVAPNDPRFLKTMDRILLPPERGGLTSTGLVYRYDSDKTEDGVGGREGAFSMCTFWLVEAMTRASVYEPKYLPRAVNLFENMLSFSNHLMMFSEEISRSGEQLGNTPQAFSHLAMISAAFNLDRASENCR